jgi:superfamily II DNA or RNA helicase
MHFSSTLYPYQSEILDIFEKERKRGDKKIHIVAPPGSGKTIVWLEMMTRLDVPTLILVPNLTLQEQWKDKLEKLFFESHESSEVLISTNINEIKKINIVTYQSLSGSDTLDDSINAKILDMWFLSEQDEFQDKKTFLLFVTELRSENPEEYRELYSKHRKKLKDSWESEFTRKLMKWTIHDYVANLRSAGVGLMIVDEAHHLTSWWSHVLYQIWTDLSSPHIIWLTATPPFESVDYFELDESYTKLLWTVDYYVPTPAIVKSGRLAPYSDLVYIVAPDDNLAWILIEKEKKLQDFISLHKDKICIFLHQFLIENFARLEVKSLDIMEKWMRFIYVHKGELAIDMSSYITANASKPLSLEDIAKSIGKWGADGFKKTKTSKLLSEINSLFFDLGYIWRGANLYRFETPIEKWLVYSKSKIIWAITILEKEKENLWDSLRVAVITDFLDVESDWINGHFIFDELAKSQENLNPYLVSGQWIWKLENGTKVQAVNETILSVTEKLTKWETKLVIGTRGILGEWWDCPAINTLIDLTGVSAYMSVNQVHGRAIRLDPHHTDKVANVYDIICLGNGYQWMRDFERLEKKHSQFYWVDDSGLVIKELDHIYPQLERMITNPEKINNYTMKKSALRSMVAELWGIGGEYKNEEIFSLSIEILKPYESLYLPSTVWTKDLRALYEEMSSNQNLLELGKTAYHAILREGIEEIIDATLQVMRQFDLIPDDFRYSLNWTDNGSITIMSNYRDPLVSKKFIETIAPLFNTVTDQKYILKCDSKDWFLIHKLQKNDSSKNKATKISDYIILIIVTFIIFPLFINIFLSFNDIIMFLTQLFQNTEYLFFWLFIFVPMILSLWSFLYWKKEPIKISKEQILRETQVIFFNESNSIGLPDNIVSNEGKRKWFTGKEYGAIPEEMKWYSWFLKNTNSLKWYSKFLLICFTILIVIYILSYESLFLPLIILLSILWTICIKIMLYFIHLFSYGFYAKIYNALKRRKAIFPTWSIEPTSQSDIGKPSYLSAKIEKLWI